MVDDIMKCPYCGNIMICGNICARGGGGMYWIPEEEQIKFYETISKKTIEKHKGIVISIDDIGTIKYPSYICKTCNKILLEF